MIIERFKKDAVTPTRGTKFSAGLDLTVIDFKLVEEKSPIVMFGTGLKVQIPDSNYGIISIRSGLAKKGKWMIANGEGKIDSDYRGEIKVMMRYMSQWPENAFMEAKELIGKRVAQLIIQPYNHISVELDTVDSTERDGDGFGSTGD